MRTALKTAFAKFLNQIAVALVISVVVVMLISLVFSSQSAQQTHLFRTIGCELGVPAIDGVRDPGLLRNCWTDEGLTPPSYFDEVLSP